MNETSSRSHAVFLVFIEQVTPTKGGANRVVRTQLSLIDLAGSERQQKSGIDHAANERAHAVMQATRRHRASRDSWESDSSMFSNRTSHIDSDADVSGDDSSEASFDQRRSRSSAENLET